MTKKPVNPYSAPASTPGESQTESQSQDRDQTDEKDIDWFWPIWIFGVVLSIFAVATMVFLLRA